MAMSTTPPTISAFPQQREPNFFPIATPTRERRNVMTPMETTETNIRARVDAPTAVGRIIPVASASMLVATANARIVFSPGCSF